MNIERSSGMLLHITSLPGKYGIGTLGSEAREFANQLKKAGMRYWQVLPIGPVEGIFDFCPYASPSTFAGNPLFISLDDLAAEPWCGIDIPSFDRAESPFVDFEDVMRHKVPCIVEAYQRFRKSPEAPLQKYIDFCNESSHWLDDYALFSAAASHIGTLDWTSWEPGLAHRDPHVMKKWSDKLLDEIEHLKFLQYVFFTQWDALKKYCNECGIFLIGDIPIYITMDGADSWAHREMLQLDPETGKPESVSGVPPDYFSATGQRWGNPVYRWRDSSGRLGEAAFKWWVRRISHLHRHIDIIRVDHFRGFEAYWSIPADEQTAINGEWVPGPGIEFFNHLQKELGDLPLIAEDLGVITPEVEKLRDDLGLPGMKILQFAFDFNNRNYYLPHNYSNPNFIVYTGTHDNNTTNGWFYGSEIDDNTRNYALEYLGAETFSDFHWKLIRQAYRSVARLVMFPAQDVLGYGREFRMNTPGTCSDNWRWKLTRGAITGEIIAKLRRMGEIYDRIRDDENDKSS
jgi:4-alpha-glucanotransferase